MKIMHLVNVYSTSEKSLFLSINGKKIVFCCFFKGFKKKFISQKNYFFKIYSPSKKMEKAKEEKRNKRTQKRANGAKIAYLKD